MELELLTSHPLGWLSSEIKSKWKIFMLTLIWNLKGIPESKTVLRKWNKLEVSHLLNLKRVTEQHNQDSMSLT